MLQFANQQFAPDEYFKPIIQMPISEPNVQMREKKRSGLFAINSCTSHNPINIGKNG